MIHNVNNQIQKIFERYCNTQIASSFYFSKGFSEKIIHKFNLIEVDKLYDDKDFRSLFQNKTDAFYRNYRYIIPGFDEYGKIDYLIFRRDENCDICYKDKQSVNYLHKHEYAGDINRGLGKLYNPYPLLNLNLENIFLVESWTDALSIEEIGYSALAMNRVANANTVFKLLLDRNKEKIKSKMFIIMCDNDSIGQDANEEISKILDSYNLRYRIINNYPVGIKDANEWLVSDKEGFSYFINTLVRKNFNG